MPPNRVSQIVRGTRSITADTALRLAQYFGTTPEFWLNLQNHYELELARDGYEKPLAKVIRPLTGTQRA